MIRKYNELNQVEKPKKGQNKSTAVQKTAAKSTAVNVENPIEPISNTEMVSCVMVTKIDGPLPILVENNTEKEKPPTFDIKTLSNVEGLRKHIIVKTHIFLPICGNCFLFFQKNQKGQ